jgi:murein DD-endopeptidase MepM/ murein hydrolase activator NlpD
MDDIIARQKIARRRPSPRPVSLRAGPAAAYSPSYDQQLRAFPRRGAPGRRRAPHFSSLASGFLSRLRTVLAPARRTFRLPGSLKAPTRRQALLLLAGLATLLVLAGGLTVLLRGPSFPLPAGGLLPAEDSAQNLLLDYASPELGASGNASDPEGSPALPPAPVMLELSTYTARPGDSLASIAKRFGLYMDTIISANGISSSRAIKPGMALRIPNINGLIHKTRPGDSLSSIAKRYKTDTTRIVDANDLGSSQLLSGQSLFIPGARLPPSEVSQALGQRVAWPLRGPLSSFFGYRADPFTGVRRFHAGVDIVTNSGSPVRAAMDGRVSDSGYNANYGNYLILNHADGYQSLYGHLSAAIATTGSKVSQGDLIGLSGNTGYSTGPHLHFGLFRNGLPINPLKYLK